MRRYALRDDQWDRIKDFLPGREGHVGGTAADNRLLKPFCTDIEPAFHGVIFPSVLEIGKSSTSASTSGRRAEFLSAFFELLASDRDNEYMMIDATIVRAHQHSAGARKKGEQAIGRSRGGLTTSRSTANAIWSSASSTGILQMTPELA